MNINQPELADNFLPETIHRSKNNLLKFLIIGLMGTGILGVSTYFVLRENKLNADQKLIQTCIEKKRCYGTISALERLVKAKKSLRLSNLSNAHLENAHLENAHFESVNLSSANLTNAHLEKAHLESANLEGANLEKAHLENANLRSANLAITQVDRAHLENAHLENAHLSHAHLENSYLVNADLSNAYLSNAHFNKSYFNRANLSGAHFYRTNFNHSNFNRANLAKAYFYRANFDGVNFYSTNLRGTSLIEATNLTFAQIKSACNWEEAIYKGIWDTNRFKWVPDRAANQKFIQQVRQDKASNPTKPIDCSLWEE